MQKASVIVVTYNRKNLLKYCLQYLLNQSISDYEIIVVDDGSDDGTEKLEELKKVKYIQLKQRKGQPYVRNVGIKEAKGEIIIFVDSDVMVDYNFVKDHIEVHKKEEKIIVQGVVRHIPHIKDIGKFTLKIDGLSYLGLVTQNVSIKRKWLLKVGLMDENFGTTMGYEDIDLGRRLKKLGLKVKHGWRKCKAYHIDGYPTFSKFSTSFQKRYEWSKNIVYFGNKHGRFFIQKTKVWFFSTLFLTSYWANKEEAIKLLTKLIDFPIFFLAPLLKEIMKYYYRRKGIEEGLKLLNENLNRK
jgi:glycosyltransferase involved in cell wall biosynthesis